MSILNFRKLLTLTFLFLTASSSYAEETVIVTGHPAPDIGNPYYSSVDSSIANTILYGSSYSPEAYAQMQAAQKFGLCAGKVYPIAHKYCLSMANDIYYNHTASCNGKAAAGLGVGAATGALVIGATTYGVGDILLSLFAGGATYYGADNSLQCNSDAAQERDYNLNIACPAFEKQIANKICKNQ